MLLYALFPDEFLYHSDCQWHSGPGRSQCLSPHNQLLISSTDPKGPKPPLLTRRSPVKCKVPEHGQGRKLGWEPGTQGEFRVCRAKQHSFTNIINYCIIGSSSSRCCSSSVFLFYDIIYIIIYIYIWTYYYILYNIYYLLCNILYNYILLHLCIFIY